ncbi:thioesterase II family protein [Streptomyces sp. NL15-2K]|uniref:thioesterase II family protein n=1 Tax=Streptomyces sp. NL15-2K TaxID=376149 RepID=UPI000F560D99|nr:MULTISPECIES: alpha/beta fold hydrolase [Actinomycetes]WKX12816.1 alpha/beta fold hydrolase [Kutzneria buriramensis]GCB45878.1 thioesterase in siderophore biosynthesis gene cluster [Streptomyces sp. NL15-2K]
MSVGAHRTAPSAVVDNDRWFRRYSVTAAPRRRLLVLPHAGGSASFFHAWGTAFDSGTEVLVARYPGRHDRLTDPCVDSMEELADRVTAALLPFLDVPVTLFGHSMGASLAYEVALRLHGRHAVRPAALHVSSRRPPHRLTPRELHKQGDEALIEEVRRLGGTDESLLTDPDLREIVLPAIRADFTIVGTYGPRDAAPVDCPVYAYIGDQDPSTSVHDMSDWSDVTTEGFHLDVLPGGHFYLVDHQETLVRTIADRLPPTD